MPRGTPISLKCPKCKRGKYSYPPKIEWVKRTGVFETKLTFGKHKGSGAGGRRFYGYKGEVECLDCKHKWFSTLAGKREE